ncbi:MAG: hypothetical protein QM689_03405 [Oscillospiraceae bacterium]
MKRNTLAVITASILLAGILGSCGKNDSNSSSSKTDATTTTAATTTKTDSSSKTDDAANSEQVISIDDSAVSTETDAFFGKDTKEVLKSLDPLIVSAATAQYQLGYDFYDGSENADTFAWAVIYSYIDRFSDPIGGAKWNSDQTLTVSGDTMTKYFTTAFSAFEAPVPEISADSMISYDSAAKIYTVTYGDSEVVSFELTKISLSKANSAADPTMSATLAIEIQNPDGDAIGTVDVEVVKNEKSVLGFSVSERYGRRS